MLYESMGGSVFDSIAIWWRDGPWEAGWLSGMPTRDRARTQFAPVCVLHEREAGHMMRVYSCGLWEGENRPFGRSIGRAGMVELLH